MASMAPEIAPTTVLITLMTPPTAVLMTPFTVVNAAPKAFQTSPIVLATDLATSDAVCQIPPISLKATLSTVRSRLAAAPMIGNTTRPIATKIGQANWMILTITKKAVRTAPATCLTMSLMRGQLERTQPATAPKASPNGGRTLVAIQVNA